MHYSNKPTAVTNEIVGCDCTVIAEMTDGQLVTLSSPWGVPSEADMRRWRFLTKEQLIEQVRSWNEQRRYECNHALHLDKERRFGPGYARRGY